MNNEHVPRRCRIKALHFPQQPLHSRVVERPNKPLCAQTSKNLTVGNWTVEAACRSNSSIPSYFSLSRLEQVEEPHHFLHTQRERIASRVLSPSPLPPPPKTPKHTRSPLFLIQQWKIQVRYCLMRPTSSLLQDFMTSLMAKLRRMSEMLSCGSKILIAMRHLVCLHSFLLAPF